ncbi:hypothetical protein [Helicobacter trogontum]|uniref:Lipoprotein n=1 Tax=Helicobacter trogontum TaxID=50960 RepID=A0A099VB81_9HELI|nr:hypothetical protein [Helicobacter trogontum]TLD79318.1 hypothetical protein LS81_010790 [Helicobacter trogontum]
MPFKKHELFFTLLSTSLMSFVGCADLLKLSQDTREKVNHPIQALANKNNNQTDTEENRQIDCSELPQDIADRFKQYHAMAKDDDSFNDVTIARYDWEKFYSDQVITGSLVLYGTEEKVKFLCETAEQAYKEIMKENPNILKVQGLKNKLKAEEKLLGKVHSRFFRLKEQAEAKRK